MYNPYGYESEIASLFEDQEDYEALRPRRPGAVRTPPRGGVIPPRPDAGFATRTELNTAVSRLDGKIGTASTAIQTLDGRVGAIGADVTKMKAATDQLKKSVDDVRQLSVLLPLLTQETTRAVTGTVAGTNLSTTDKIVVDSGDSFSKLLPVLLLSGGLGGLGGSSSGSSSGSGGDLSSILPLILILSMKK